MDIQIFGLGSESVDNRGVNLLFNGVVDIEDPGDRYAIPLDWKKLNKVKKKCIIHLTSVSCRNTASED